MDVIRSKSARSTEPTAPPPNPLTLAAAKRTALRDNPGVQAAAARVRAAAALARQAQASYYPTLSAAAEVKHTEKVPDADGLTDADPYQSYGLSGTASWLVFDGFARKFNVLAARYGESSSHEAYRDARRLLIHSVAAAFYNSLLAQENILISRQDADFNRKLSEETKKRFDAGAAARSDVLNFDIRTTQAESRYVNAELDMRTAKTVLAALLGVPDAALPPDVGLGRPDQETLDQAIPTVEAELEDALEARPDLVGLEQTIRRLRAQLQAKKAEYWPTVSLTAGYGASRTDNPRFNDGRDDTSYVGLAAVWELFSGGSTRHACCEIEARLAAALEALAQTRIEIVSALRREIDAAHVARTQLRMKTDIDRMTSEVRDLVRNEYLAGRASLTRLNEAQTDLVRASGQLALARIRYWQALENVAAASGRNLTIRE